MKITYRPAAPADFPQMVALLQKQNPTEPVTMETFLQQEQRRAPGAPFLRLTVESGDGAFVGFGFASQDSAERPDVFEVRVRVDEPFRRQLIGTTLYYQLEFWARRAGAARLESSVRELDTSSQNWARDVGFATEGHVFEASLDLTAWDPEAFRAPVEAAEATGIRFRTLADEPPGEETLRRFHGFVRRLESDIPGRGPRTPAYEQWREEIGSDPDWNPAGVILAVDGDQWAALSRVTTLPNGEPYNELTGVAAEYRGRGLAVAVKVKALEYARSTGARVIHTHNHSVNQPMLAANRKLGYVAAPGVFQVFKQLS